MNTVPSPLRKFAFSLSMVIAAALGLASLETVSGVARGKFRAAYLRQLLAQMPRAIGVCVRAHQQLADGFLLAGSGAPGCAPARH